MSVFIYVYVCSLLCGRAQPICMCVCVCSLFMACMWKLKDGLNFNIV